MARYANITVGCRRLLRRAIQGGAAALLLGTSACGEGQSAAQVVASTRHCGGVGLGPDLLMRLSSYRGHPDSIELWVVQACHRTGTACRPIVTYDHALPPAYSLSEDGKILIELLGGHVTEIHEDNLSMSGRDYRIEVRKVVGMIGDEGLNAFRSRIGLPPGRWDRDICAQLRDINPDLTR